MKQAVLFDCDGVLVDSEEGLSKIAAFVLETYFDIPAKPADFAPFIGTGEDSYIGEVVRKYKGVYIQEMKNRIYTEYIESAQQYVEAVFGAKELILKLRAEGIKVAVASSADLPKVDVNLKILGLNHEDFDAVITGSDVSNKKPDPDIYLTAAAKCGVKAKDCIVIEDATSGVQAGKNAGMFVIGFTSSVKPETLILHGADKTVATMHEMDGIIHGLD